jgi:hypothetical protein
MAYQVAVPSVRSGDGVVLAAAIDAEVRGVSVRLPVKKGSRLAVRLEHAQGVQEITRVLDPHMARGHELHVAVIVEVGPHEN